MRLKNFLAALVACFSLYGVSAAAAQDATPGSEARRLQLAGELIAVSTGRNMSKMLEDYVASELEAMGAEGEEADWMRTNMPPMMSRMVERMMADMRPAYAETFTVAELEAQIAFYSTPMGRTIAEKTVQLGIAQEDAMQAAVEVFTAEFERKFCAAFYCSDDGSTASKPARN